eukprot:5608557-Pleurochrysis_carterae.AAC.2
MFHFAAYALPSLSTRSRLQLWQRVWRHRTPLFPSALVHVVVAVREGFKSLARGAARAPADEQQDSKRARKGGGPVGAVAEAQHAKHKDGSLDTAADHQRCPVKHHLRVVPALVDNLLLLVRLL